MAGKGRGSVRARGLELSSPAFWAAAGVLMLGLLLLTFRGLGDLPARDWDEARHGVSAYEMQKTGNQIVNTYLYEPDYYNLKPPLSFYGIELGYLLFGHTLFGMRFYSAAAFALTALCTGWFCLKRYGKFETLLVLLLLLCCAPFFSDHFARHGDADALFTLFSLTALFSTMLLSEKPWALAALSGSFALAFLTKSWHALFIPAAAFAYILYKRLLSRFSWKQWLAFLAAGALPILAWAFLRYQADGWKFLGEMVRVDLLNRSAQVLERHSGGVFYYIEVMFTFSPTTGWLPLFTGAVYAVLRLIGLKRAAKPVPSFLGDLPGYAAWLLIPFVAFSFVRTKLWWYVFPLYFPLLIATAAALAGFLRGDKKSGLLRYCVLGVAAVLLALGLWGSVRAIRPPFADPLQNIIASEGAALAPTKGKRVVISDTIHSTFDYGTQVYCLLGELYDDWKPVVQRIDAFAADPQASVLVVEEAAYQSHPELAAYTTLLVRDGYRVLQKG